MRKTIQVQKVTALKLDLEKINEDSFSNSIS